MTTLDKDILASLRDHEQRDAHKLYDAGVTFVALVDLYSPAVLRAVADRLAEEAQRASEANEKAMLLAMVAYLGLESDGR